jgi:50S ribosomal protein L16 3-hydroxylase
MISFGKLSVEQFQTKHWQKRPLLVRNALLSPRSLISKQELLTLSQNGQCDARLVTRGKNDAWQLTHGPFIDSCPNKSPFPKKDSWTVLVQGVDTVNANINGLMADFRFAGDALLDDVMISYATDGGGVGPHLDSYDVFLIQLHGQRRWQISPPKSTPADFKADLPVKILKTFAPTQEWLLDPGDMLYLPAGWGHDGVAIGECITASVGFRAPHRNEWLNAYLDDLSDSLEDILSPTSKRLKISQTQTSNKISKVSAKKTRLQPARIVTAIPEQFGDWVDELLGKGVAEKPINHAHIHELTGRFLTEPKNQTVFTGPAKPLMPTVFAKGLRDKGVRLSLASKCLYTQTSKTFFINGESFSLSAKQLKVLSVLADTKTLGGQGFNMSIIDADLMESLYDWYKNGWIAIQ